MKKRLASGFLAAALLTGALVPLTAEVTYNRCWSDCHDMAMQLLPAFGMDIATDTFHACMEMCQEMT